MPGEEARHGLWSIQGRHHHLCTNATENRTWLRKYLYPKCLGFTLTYSRRVKARMMSRPLPSNATPSWWDGHKDAKSGSASHPFSVQWLGMGKVAYSLFESPIPDFQAFQDGQEIPFEVGLQILRVIDQTKNGGNGARSSSL